MLGRWSPIKDSPGVDEKSLYIRVLPKSLKGWVVYTAQNDDADLYAPHAVDQGGVVAPPRKTATVPII